MRNIFTKHGTTVVVAAVVAAVTTAAPTIAGTIADFARNAHRVDGHHAVAATASRDERAGKLVATGQGGRLPNDIVRKVRSAGRAGRLRSFGPGAFVRGCFDGALRGQAFVRTATDDEFERVPGFSTTYGGPLNTSGTSCHLGNASARRVATGVYDVRLALIAWSCDDPMDEGLITALVSVRSDVPRVATYEPLCLNDNVYVRVRITDLNGTNQDAPFAVALLQHSGVPVP